MRLILELNFGNYIIQMIKTCNSKIWSKFSQKRNNQDRKFLLICGFENFKNFYIRVDILERLFLKIIKNTIQGTFKLIQI